MEWMIIVLIMMSLVGSMMWVMPTQRQKYQAALRMKAKQLGFQVQLEKVTPPRGKGELEPDSRDMTSYRVLRQGMSREEKNNFNSWHVFRHEAIANIGLPQGWSWSSGERKLSENELIQLNEFIQALPEGVFSIESSAVFVGVHWNEEGGEEVLESLYALLDQFSQKGF